MDLSLPVPADFPSADAIRLSLLRRAARGAVSYQTHDYPHQALRVTVRPSGWWQALLRRTKTIRMWRLVDSPFDNLCLGEDDAFYLLVDGESPLAATAFPVEACTPHATDRITEILFDMCAPARW